MSAEESNHWSLDDLLFAKFAELDQKVALLREEMDSIASLLERRKRIRDSSISMANQILNDAERLPHWSHIQAWRGATPQQVVFEGSPPTLSFASEADRILSGRLYDADLPIEHEEPSALNGRSANAVSSPRTTFHPYRRPTTNHHDALSSSLLATKRTALPALFMSDFHGMMDDVLVLENDDGAEDPPSDPDDSGDVADGN